MPITDYIPEELIQRDGYIHEKDTARLIDVLFPYESGIAHKRLKPYQIAEWIGESTYRLEAYIEDCRIEGIQILDSDGCLSPIQIRQIDWTPLKRQRWRQRAGRTGFSNKKKSRFHRKITE